ncbi:MAG: copper resistance protein NlpE N-terminal domain-containing protein [Brachymonas sp.]|nr:copper resistance protein NlpE N-terminal domain-containing protein [Brachymonas sp.]
MSFSSLFARTRQWPTLAACAITALFIAGCGSSPKPVPKPSKPRPRPPVVRRVENWMGTYRGTVPCASLATPGCTAQQLTLTLLPGDQYELETTVQRGGRPYTIMSKGRFQWDAGRTVITLASKDENARLRIGPNTLERLPGLHDDVQESYHGYILRKP